MQKFLSLTLVSIVLLGSSICGDDARADEPVRNWGFALAANIPHPVTLSLEYQPSATFSMALGLGGLNLRYQRSSASLPIDFGILAADIRGRWHPFQGAFFLGVSAGQQRLTGSGTTPILVSGVGTVNTTVGVEIYTPFITPHLGWNWVTKGGFSFGIEPIGIQLPLGTRSGIIMTTDQALTNAAVDILRQTADYQNLEAQVAANANPIGLQILPFVTVLRLGWMF